MKKRSAGASGISCSSRNSTSSPIWARSGARVLARPLIRQRRSLRQSGASRRARSFRRNTSHLRRGFRHPFLRRERAFAVDILFAHQAHDHAWRAGFRARTLGLSGGLVQQARYKCWQNSRPTRPVRRSWNRPSGCSKRRQRPAALSGDRPRHRWHTSASALRAMTVSRRIGAKPNPMINVRLGRQHGDLRDSQASFPQYV